jgi:hypothetical protein
MISSEKINDPKYIIIKVYVTLFIDINQKNFFSKKKKRKKNYFDKTRFSSRIPTSANKDYIYIYLHHDTCNLQNGIKFLCFKINYRSIKGFDV